MFKWSRLNPLTDYWNQRNPTIDQNYCSVPLPFWYNGIKIVKMVKMAGLQGHSLKGVINAL